MLKPCHNRKPAFMSRVNKAEATSNRKKQMKIPNSRKLQLKEECKFSSTSATIEIPKECNEE